MIHSLISRLNEKFNNFEDKLVSKHCDNRDESDMPPGWRIAIENILTKADQVWPTDTTNDTAIKTKEDFFKVLKQDQEPVRIYLLRQFAGFYANEEEFKPFIKIVREMWKIILFPDDINSTLQRLHTDDKGKPITMNADNFDEIVNRALSIEQLKGFPNVNDEYRYSDLINQLVQNDKSGTKPHYDESIEESKVRWTKEDARLAARKQLLIEFRPYNHLQHFVNAFNAVVRIYRSPKHRAALKKLTGLVDFVRSLEPNPNIESAKISAVVAEAKTLKDVINFNIFDEKFFGSSYIGSVKGFVNGLAEAKIESFPVFDLQSLVLKIDAVNVWKQLHNVGRFHRVHHDPLNEKEFYDDWQKVANGELTFYLDFLRK